MGLPEIVDFARNFAVMVRVQGPDPKGLKMRKHAFHHYHSGKTTLSASGMLLPDTLSDISASCKHIHSNNDQNSMLVVSVASILEPFLSLQHRENISQGSHPELIHGVQIDVMVEENNSEELDKKAPHWLPVQLLALVDVPAFSLAVQSIIEASSGSREQGWDVGWSLASYTGDSHTLVDAIQTQLTGIFVKLKAEADCLDFLDGFRFSSGLKISLVYVEHQLEVDCNAKSSIEGQRHFVVGDSSHPSLMGKSTARIALLGVSSINSKDLPNIAISPSNKRGDLLLAMGSPFGVLSPVHFFNSISVGSIANCYTPSPSGRSLLMADIRCLPGGSISLVGMEGGPVFNEHAQLIGILTRPLRQKTGGAEIQLVIPWEAIATACCDLLQKEQPDCCSPPLSLIEKAMASICLVTIDDGVWASGVVLNSQGLILTNAHLLEPWRFGKTVARGMRALIVTRRVRICYQNIEDCRFFCHGWTWGYKSGSTYRGHRNIRIRLDHTDPRIWCDARVVYVSKGPLDIALLQLEFVPGQLCPIIMDFACPSAGSKAYVIGHGLFGLDV
ncbi:Glyoxysomal processing protease, glyoxysomal [Vitis vinifera]|uniref:Glyoxysomal processing protease, glyoxysomal n=1 Tax=Vitis vinifera TaxID=29760 RepID=A0A438IGB2_VITVI|nr:Glyoxysomal processing protease, glyoxysomal [Vitis vinifera]